MQNHTLILKDVIYIYTYTHTHTHIPLHTHTPWHITQPFKKKRKEILPFVVTWIDLVGIILSEISQSQISCDFTHMWNLKKQTKQCENRFKETENKII